MPSNAVRRTVYWKRGQPITLAYVSGIYATPRMMRRIVAS